MRLAPRIAIVVSVLTLVASIVGFVGMLVLNAFVLDEYDAYGEIPIPGSGSVHLPAGEATVSFHTLATGQPTGGFPIPDLRFAIEAPNGAPDPEVTESVGATTSINSDVHVRIWTVQIPEEGDYHIEADGNVNGYIAPRLAFGHDSSHSWLLWVFGGLFAIGVLELIAALIWSTRARKTARPLEPRELATLDAPSWDSLPPPPPSADYTPNDQGIRIEQIRHLAALRDSGALTEEEYTAEKRRILDS